MCTSMTLSTKKYLRDISKCFLAARVWHLVPPRKYPLQLKHPWLQYVRIGCPYIWYRILIWQSSSLGIKNSVKNCIKGMRNPTEFAKKKLCFILNSKKCKIISVGIQLEFSTEWNTDFNKPNSCRIQNSIENLARKWYYAENRILQILRNTYV